jgi:O-antigen ligase
VSQAFGGWINPVDGPSGQGCLAYHYGVTRPSRELATLYSRDVLVERTRRPSSVKGLFHFAIASLVPFLAGAAVPSIGSLALPVSLGAFVILAAGALGCLALTVIVILSGLNGQVSEISGVTIYVADLLYCPLVFMVLAKWFVHPPNRDRSLLTPVAVFVSLIGISIVLRPEDVAASTVSWARLAQTASFAWLTAIVIQRREHLSLILYSIALGGVLGIVVAALESWGTLFQTRVTGPINVNTFGLISAILILLSVFALPARARLSKYFLVLLGLIGLILAQSVAAFFACAVAVGIGHIMRMKAAGLSLSPRTRAIVGLGLTILIGFLVISSFRPEMIPTSDSFRTSSASHRITLGTAGIELFLSHPVMGVGWRQSSNPELIGSPVIRRQVAKNVPILNPAFLPYPDLPGLSVHNAYIQLLAEFGLVGIVILILLVRRIWSDVRALLVRLRPWPELHRHGIFAVASLSASLVWFNGNPIYGGQPETFMMALMLGMLSALAALRDDLFGRGEIESHDRHLEANDL